MSDEEIQDVFASLGPVTIRCMFSGKGVYVEGVIVAIVYGDELRLKADRISGPKFAAAGATQWAYAGHRGEVMMPYWSIPDEALDDADLMAIWTRLAMEAGRRADVKKVPSARRRP